MSNFALVQSTGENIVVAVTVIGTVVIFLPWLYYSCGGGSVAPGSRNPSTGRRPLRNSRIRKRPSDSRGGENRRMGRSSIPSRCDSRAKIADTDDGPVRL